MIVLSCQQRIEKNICHDAREISDSAASVAGKTFAEENAKADWGYRSA